MQTVFDTIKDRLPITDVLATYITLIPSGNQVKAKCPFHNERSASFSVSPERGLYYCFGCGAKGDIFTFVEQFEGVDRKGALKILADKAGVVLTRDTEKRESTDPLYDILETTTMRYQQELARNDAAREYVASRGITPATVAAFRIGYAPDEWRFVANATPTIAHAAIAERAGLTKKTDKGYYDRFRKRIMFPLMDTTGRVVGFSGRIYPADPDAPKYLNSPETELFQKSRILFGFDKAKAAIRTHNFVTLVEGQMDCVLAHQAGFKNTVATSGTAVSEAAAADPSANLTVLARLTPNIFLAFDGDAAGQKALDHAAIVALGLGMNPKVVPLPLGIDPADYIQAHGAEGWKALLKESQHFILHQMRNISRTGMSPHVLVQALKDRVFPFLVRVQSPVEQHSYLTSIAHELDIPTADLTSEFARFVTAGSNVIAATAPIPKVQAADIADTISITERFLGLIERYPTERGAKHKHALETLSFEEHTCVVPPISPERLVVVIPSIERDYGPLTEDERDMVIAEFAKKLQEHFFAEIRMTYSKALNKAERDNNEEEVQRIMGTLQILNQRRHGQS